ncbi:Uncharacterised protein [Mycolicibacterium aurum]|jgi:hypothetical protein|uniref:Uncharacterized protein n=1 Tax=Mycolicibacterium aurum TaxID=1791 RepID=A0A448IQ15_MYCAU|nr:hypothetical protein [Mycolicibacterium aurum]VEG54515.1 Uncharacterised protein [Mycolicibacterium aurum]
MTALQDWINISPVNPNSIKAVIVDALRGLTSDDSAPDDQPQLMGRGLERC